MKRNKKWTIGMQVWRNKLRKMLLNIAKQSLIKKIN